LIKIVFISTGLSIGGAEIMLLKLLERIDRTVFSPHVISLTSPGDLAQRFIKLGVPVHSVGLDAGSVKIAPFARLFSLLRALKPDIVQTWMYHADLIGGLVAWASGCQKIVWALRNSDLSQERTKRTTLWVVTACSKLSNWLPSTILSCSKRACAVHASLGYECEKFYIIPNGFDLDLFQPDEAAREDVRAELGLSSDTRIVGLMARYDPQKNHLGFLDAAAVIHQRMPDVHFVLAGTGVDGGNVDLLNAITQQGLNGRIHLLGRRDDMPRLMAALDVLASSSAFGEAFPNVIGEAMACGVPCVVTDVGDSAEIVGATGRVVGVQDMQGLASHIVELLALPEVKKADLSRQTRERIASLFEIGEVTRRYQAFYERTAKGRI